MKNLARIAISLTLCFACIRAGYLGGGDTGGDYGGFDAGYGGGDNAGYDAGGDVSYGGDDDGKDYNAYPKYNFNYAVNDPHTGDEKQHNEERDGDQVKGSYALKEADGTTRIVEYQADGHNGFNAVVHKVGTPTHGSGAGGSGGYGSAGGYADAGGYGGHY